MNHTCLLSLKIIATEHRETAVNLQVLPWDGPAGAARGPNTYRAACGFQGGQKSGEAEWAESTFWGPSIPCRGLCLLLSLLLGLFR